MGLYERWTDPTELGTTKIPVHTFAAALREHSRGVVTRQQLIDAFSLVGDDVTELDAIRNKYTVAPDKEAFIVKLHDVMLLSEAGFYTRVKAALELGF